MSWKWIAIGVGAYFVLTRSSSSSGQTSNGYLPNSTPPGQSTLPGIAPPFDPFNANSWTGLAGGGCGNGIFC